LTANLSFNVVVQTPFGLTAASGQSLYVSDWDKKAIFAVNIGSNPATLTEVISGVALPMSLQYSRVSGLISLYLSLSQDHINSTFAGNSPHRLTKLHIYVNLQIA